MKNVWFKLQITLLGLMTMGLLSSAIAADGKALFEEKLCITCHGPEGKAPIADEYPKLAGQNKGYLVQQIKDIRDGVRTNGQTSSMRPLIAGQLSDTEAEAIATYLSKLTP